MKFLENLLSTIVTIGIYIDIDYNWDPAPPYIPDVELNLPGHIENSEDSDSDWANNEDDCCSTTGYLFKIAGGPVSWASRRQKMLNSRLHVC